MRPLPIEGVAATPAYILGLAVIRGIATPVVDLAVLLGAPQRSDFARFVTVRGSSSSDATAAALAVEAVIGVEVLPAGKVGELPPLVSATSPEIIQAVGSADERLLLLLRQARLCPPELEALWSTPEVQP